MGVTFGPADSRVQHAAAKLRAEFHKTLDEAGVTIYYLMAYAPRDRSGKPKGPSLMLHGYPCAAIVKVNSLLLRAQGLLDCTIRIDGDDWADRPDDEKLAIIDHELEHVEVFVKSRDRDGEVVYETDDLGRPVTNLKPHDFHGGGFRSIVKRHQGAALETKFAIDTSLQMQRALEFDPTPIVAEKLTLPNISFRDAVRRACEEGRLCKDHPAAHVLGRREHVLPDGEVVRR